MSYVFLGFPVSRVTGSRMNNHNSLDRILFKDHSVERTQDSLEDNTGYNLSGSSLRTKREN